MVTDVVKAMGYLALGTRLKRLGERLQSQTEEVLTERGFTTPASHFPLLGALDRLGTLNVGELTEAVGMSQPGVTRMLDKLEHEGLVRSTQSVGDKRVRAIALTRAGRTLVARAKRLAWPVVEGAVTDACGGAAQSLLASLEALEDALAAASLSARAAASSPTERSGTLEKGSASA